MKKALIIFLVVAVAGILLYVYGRKLADTVLDTTAFDENDNIYYQKIVDAIKASKYSKDLAYIEKAYNAKYKPGAVDAPSDEYGTIGGKTTKTSGLMKAVWTAWKGSHENEPEAKQLLQDVATIWEQYKYLTLKNLTK